MPRRRGWRRLVSEGRERQRGIYIVKQIECMEQEMEGAVEEVVYGGLSWGLCEGDGKEKGGGRC